MSIAFLSSSMEGHPMKFTVISECPISKARVAKMELPHHVVDTPVFMPVGTQGTLKGMTPKQLEAMNCQIMLGNAYHLGNRPVNQHLHIPTNECYYGYRDHHY